MIILEIEVINLVGRRVVPEREAPGKIAATNCPTPMATAMGQVMDSLNGFPFSHASSPMNSTPPTHSASATGCAVSGSSK